MAARQPVCPALACRRLAWECPVRTRVGPGRVVWSWDTADSGWVVGGTAGRGRVISGQADGGWADPGSARSG